MVEEVKKAAGTGRPAPNTDAHKDKEPRDGVNDQEGEKSEAPKVAARPAAPAPSARPPSAPPRSDSFCCPSCGKFGCPAVGGSKLGPKGTTRYRACSSCGKRCITHTPFGSIREAIVVADYRGQVEERESGPG